jgi:hypothetical protein
MIRTTLSIPKMQFLSPFNIEQCRIKLQNAINNHCYVGILKNDHIKGLVGESTFTIDLFRSYPTRKHNLCHVIGEFIPDEKGTMIRVKFKVPFENIFMCAIFLFLMVAIIIQMRLFAQPIGMLIFIPILYLVIYTTLEYEYKMIRSFLLLTLTERTSSLKITDTPPNQALKLTE